MNQDPIDSLHTITDVKSEIETRASRVRQLLSKSAMTWLDIASEVADAKAILSNTEYETFLKKSALSRPIADKLLSIAKAKILYRDESKEFLDKLEGWTTLYEVAKLDEADVRDMYRQLQKTPAQCLTRSFIQQFKERKIPKNSRQLTVATIALCEDDVKRLDYNEFLKLRDNIESVSRIIDQSPLAARMTLHIKALEKAEAIVLSSSPDHSGLEEYCDSVEITAPTIANLSCGSFSTTTH